MQVQHVIELFSLDGEDFIKEVYRNLLGREPDECGLRYYLGRLALGYDKANVLAQVAKSSGCRPQDELMGLKAFLAEQRRVEHWFWGRWKRYSRMGRSWQGGVAGLGHIGQQMVEEQINLAHKVADMSVQIVNGLQQISVSSAFSVPAQPQVRHLSNDAVRQAFQEVLGREPEGVGVVAHHAAFPSVQALREALIASEEFQQRMDSLPEYARSIFRRMQLQRSINQGV
jgi:hypothetical protein